MVSQSLLIMGASMCPSLRNALPELLDLNDIQRVVKGVVTEVGFYAHLAPSLRLAGEILNGAEGRWRGFIRDGSTFTGT